ncbi:4Fe-4S binding protein [Methanosarcina sp. Mfa9]|uniref:4Fe-4S binding protein n=1 Tax=Methanosarcina sp. Mfa9 TaxID=3439063 RepID=UPI003F82B2C1
MPEAVYADLSRCIACHACELACERENESARISVQVVRGLAAVPVSCRQCETPLCAAVCPGEALNYGDSGLEYDAEKCIGCRLCVLACPFGTAELRAGVVERCDLCQGKEIPACVATCPAGALFCAEAESIGGGIRTRRAEIIKKALGTPEPAGRRKNR